MRSGKRQGRNLFSDLWLAEDDGTILSETSCHTIPAWLGRDWRRAYVWPPAESRVTCEARQGCAEFRLVCSCESPRMETTQPPWDPAPSLFPCPEITLKV